MLLPLDREMGGVSQLYFTACKGLAGKGKCRPLYMNLIRQMMKSYLMANTDVSPNVFITIRWINQCEKKCDVRANYQLG